MNKMLTWAVNSTYGSNFNPIKWTRVPDNHNNIPTFWNGPTANKILGIKLPKNFGQGLSLDPNNTTILGGMCLINTVEMKNIFSKNIKFKSIDEFASWFSAWYPRLDQLHDAVGIPPKFCRNVVYTSEDSFFANRLSSYTGLEKEAIQKVLKEVHRHQGHIILKKYLENYGYKGDLTVVYTSEIETELKLSLKIWERLINSRFRSSDRDFAKVELMYTGLWLDILGINSATIYEPASKMILKGWLKLQNWVTEQAYGTNLNHNLGIVGYLPFLTNQGDGSVLPYDVVPNYHNFHNYHIAPENYPWYAVNLLFAKKKIIEEGPMSLVNTKISELIRFDLEQYYST
jgi:hypothetical protein